MNSPKPLRIAVAYSAGRDSTALLHACARAAQAHAGMEVWALHVHHGLSSQADEWLAHAERTCMQWAQEGLPVRLCCRRVQVSLSVGDSVEAKAREARYQALAEMAQDIEAELILLAHHRRDQAETFLLQALRGAGVNGLAAMPADIEREGLRWVRPWLTHAREAIEAYVDEHGLAYVDDDSNAHERFARNRLRLSVWPALTRVFPQAEQGLAGAAAHLQDALPGVSSWRDALVESLACSDAGAGVVGLDARRWSDLAGGERRESLMHWYRGLVGRSLPGSWVERLCHEVPALVYRGRATHWSEIGVGLYRGVLQRVDANEASVLSCQTAGLGASQLHIEAPGDVAIPAWRGGRLRVRIVAGGGVSPGLLLGVEARHRQGGERFQLGAGRPARSLKKQFQALGVPEWQRQGPLLWSGERLLFVPGLGIDARCLAPSGQPQWGLEWVPAGH